MVFGVDLSEFQSGVDYKKAVEEGGVCFAILRAGYGRDVSQKDSEFEKHYAGFGATHTPVGAYQYSYTDSVERTVDEAKAMIKWCEGKSLPLGVWYDLEEQKIYNLGKAKVCEIALAWIAEMEKAGYKAGVYASHGWFNSVLAPIREKGLRTWPALWSKNEEPGYGTVWQFGGSTNLMRDPHVAGIPGSCDQDYWMGEFAKEEKPVADKAENIPAEPAKNHPQIAKGSNGEAVKELQNRLVSFGYSVGSCGVDGDFGSDTLAAVKKFQKDNKLDVDGIVGPLTWAVIDRKASANKPAPAEIKNGDVVKLTPDARYYSGAAIPQWVLDTKWVVMEVGGDRAIINKDISGKYAICSPVNTKYLQKA